MKLEIEKLEIRFFFFLLVKALLLDAEAALLETEGLLLQTEA